MRVRIRRGVCAFGRGHRSCGGRFLHGRGRVCGRGRKVDPARRQGVQAVPFAGFAARGSRWRRHAFQKVEARVQACRQPCMDPQTRPASQEHRSRRLAVRGSARVPEVRGYCRPRQRRFEWSSVGVSASGSAPGQELRNVAPGPRRLHDNRNASGSCHHRRARMRQA